MCQDLEEKRRKIGEDCTDGGTGDLVVTPQAQVSCVDGGLKPILPKFAVVCHGGVSIHSWRTTEYIGRLWQRGLVQVVSFVLLP